MNSAYDPLGFICPVKLKAPRLLQKSWLTDSEWDQELPPKMASRWSRWYSCLHLLQNLTISRSFKPHQRISNAQLHLFCDASEKGFGAVADLRSESPAGVHAGFVAARTRIAPLKTLSIPRLELQAAVMALRLAQQIKEDTRIQIGEPIFWCDSTCVLSWIHAKKFRFHVFVENRLSEILEGSSPT